MAFDCFMKISESDTVGRIEGESGDEKHPGWIEILSFSHSIQQPAGGAASATPRMIGRADHADFVVVKTVDKSTPKLIFALSQAEHFEEVKLELCRASGKKQKYLEIKMNDAAISSFQYSGSGSGSESLPVETIAFNYGKIEWIYYQTDLKTGKPLGPVVASWDLISGRAE